MLHSANQHVKTVKYKSGDTLPLIGLGTFQLTGDQAIKTIEIAYEVGYRLIDTATNYLNHVAIGKAIKSLPRDKIYLNSKLNKFDLEKNTVKVACEKILNELNTPYLDILFLHYPKVSPTLPKTLEAMLELVENGLIKSIGVSNFSFIHLNEIKDFIPYIDVNQIEIHPYFYPKKLIDYCETNKIHVMGFRPFANNLIKENILLAELSKKHGKSWRQMVLRWLFQNNIQMIPKASTIEHLKENFSILDFELTNKEMEKISNLNKNEQTCLNEFIDYSDLISKL